MNRLLLDQGLPRSAAGILRERGWDALHVGDIGLAKAEDAEILEACRHQQRVCVTLDADFHALLAASGASSPSVIRIRIEGLRGPQVAALIEEVWARTAPDETPAAITVRRQAIRLRRLPIGSK